MGSSGRIGSGGRCRSTSTTGTANLQSTQDGRCDSSPPRRDDDGGDARGGRVEKDAHRRREADAVAPAFRLIPKRFLLAVTCVPTRVTGQK
jgi:hypothetical protein